MMLRALSIAMFLLCGVGCAGGPRATVHTAIEARDLGNARTAYAQYRDTEGTDRALLGDLAALTLELATEEDDPRVRDAAIAQLSLAGNRGLPVLERVAERDSTQDIVRARALEVLARRRQGHARALLYSMLDHNDPEVTALALGVADPLEDLERLLAALGHATPAMRRAAAKQLRGAEDERARQALSEVARVDTDPRVRSAATRSLATFGVSAIEALRARLSDPESMVRLAAVAALIQADVAQGSGVIQGLLDTPPSPAGIEAARSLALVVRDEGGNPARTEDARAYLRGALMSTSSRLRAQAAVALFSIDTTAELDQEITTLMHAEEDLGVRFQLARALARRTNGREAAEAVLVELLSAEGMPAVQSATLLARDGHDDAIAILQRSIEADDSLTRRFAARALAREAQRPDDVEELLGDPDLMVRVHAAGGILAAAN